MSARWCWKAGPSQRLGSRGAGYSFRPEADARQKVGRWGPTVFEDRLLTGRFSSVAWVLPALEDEKVRGKSWGTPKGFKCGWLQGKKA